MSEDTVKEYYSKVGLREWRRLVRDPYHRLEFDTTMHFIKKYLPLKGLVLDAGGGPGRYTIELAKLGYDVILLDLTPKLLQIAKNQIKRAKVEGKVKQLLEASIHDLSVFKDDTFDAVLCLGGALNHITYREYREKAIDELIRVAKNDAPIFVSVIGRLAVLINAIIYWPHEMENSRIYQQICETGDYHGIQGVYTKWYTSKRAIFPPAHFYLAEELEESFRKRNIKILEMVGLEGLATRHQKEINRLFRKYPNAWKNWQEIHLKTCTHPTAVGISEHFMIICRK
ncbi:MAG: class I SAM-dependent methyltransferase [Candidatus Bathyarchaeia archaeon]